MVNSYRVEWFNGYYNVEKIVDGYSEEDAIKRAKKAYGGGGETPFGLGYNPPIKCGVYGEPVAVLVEKLEEKE